MVREIRGGAVAAVSSRVTAMLLVARAARIELEHALRLAAEGSKRGYDRKLDGIILTTPGSST